MKIPTWLQTIFNWFKKPAPVQPQPPIVDQYPAHIPPPGPFIPSVVTPTVPSPPVVPMPEALQVHNFPYGTSTMGKVTAAATFGLVPPPGSSDAITYIIGFGWLEPAQINILPPPPGMTGIPDDVLYSTADDGYRGQGDGGDKFMDGRWVPFRARSSGEQRDYFFKAKRYQHLAAVYPIGAGGFKGGLMKGYYVTLNRGGNLIARQGPTDSFGYEFKTIPGEEYMLSVRMVDGGAVSVQIQE